MATKGGKSKSSKNSTQHSTNAAFSGDGKNAKALQVARGGNPLKGAYLRANVYGRRDLAFSDLDRLDNYRGGVHTGRYGEDDAPTFEPIQRICPWPLDGKTIEVPGWEHLTVAGGPKFSRFPRRRRLAV